MESGIATRKLWAQGIPVVPVLFKDKAPFIKWKAFQDRLPTAEEMDKWFRPGKFTNYAIITGKLSNLVVVDTDSIEAELWATQHLISTPVRVQTARGYHRYYRHGGVHDRRNAKISTGVDFRGDGGCVIGPFSIHGTGWTYTPQGAQCWVESLLIPEDLPMVQFK